jgi:plastocyanin
MRRRIVVFTLLAAIAAAVASSLAVAGPSGGGTATATITMKEFRFNGVKASYAPGETTFVFRNRGEFPHNFKVVYVAQGKKFGIADVAPGESRSLTVNLKPGSYVAICTVFNGFHASQGMVTHFTVGEIDLDTGQWG